MAGIDQYVMLMLHCDGSDGSTTFTDSSTNQAAKTVTAVGNAQIDTAQGKFAQSGLFDGTGDYLTVPDSADWDFGTADFTVDFWVRFNSIASNMNLFDIGDFALTAAGVQMRIDNAATTSITVTINNSAVINNVNLSQVLANDTWYHMAVARSGTTLKLFVDGVEKSSVVNSSDITGGSTAYIANTTIGGTSPLNGWMDEFRVSKGIARWTAGFTPPTAAYTAAVVKTIDGLAIASVKTINGLAIASSKSWNGALL